MSKTYDSLHMGRSSIDLYSNDVGTPFVDISSFAAYVGGSPTNISVGACRLGIKPALLTAIGTDPVGDFILHFLNNEGVETQFIPVKRRIAPALFCWVLSRRINSRCNTIGITAQTST